MKRSMEKKRANLRDVARMAEVSVATVSRVLNNPDRVRAETRGRVEQAIANLRFVPSAPARAINSGRTRVVGALIPALDSTLFALTLDAMETRFATFGLSLVVGTTRSNPGLELAKARQLVDIGIEGLIVVGRTHDPELDAIITHSSLPALAISYFDTEARLPTIGYRNDQAARIALDHLIELGHRRIAVVHSPAGTNDRVRARLDGLHDPTGQVSLKHFEMELSEQGGAEAAKAILADQAHFDAILCLSDVLAIGALHELHRARCEVPRDISIIGIDDLAVSRVSAPRLTTVRLPAVEMGAIAAEALANWVEDGIEAQPTCLKTELILRESTTRKSAVR